MKAESVSAVRAADLGFSYSRAEKGGRTAAGDKPATVLDIPLLEIPAGGCRVILGPNGCGKTTLLKLIAGLLKPDRGLLQCSSETVLVHQNPYLLSSTVFGNVAYGLKIRKTEKALLVRLVDEELANWGLHHLRDRHASKLSGGERQRAAIARAMVLKPDILLLDEPTASVDPENISQMETLIRKISDTGATIIMSTHNLDFAYRMADSLIRMEQGRIMPVSENILAGKVTGRDESFNYFECSGTRLYCPGQDGEFRRAVFSRDDVILSKDKVISSARNVLSCEVTGISAEGPERIVNLNSGFDFKSRISAASAAELGLTAGSRIFAVIKSSSVKLY